MLIPLLVFLIGLSGALSLAYGAWLIFAPAGFLVAGAECLLWSYLMSRALAVKRQNKETA
jgi:hypothetical protein